MGVSFSAPKKTTKFSGTPVAFSRNVFSISLSMCYKYNLSIIQSCPALQRPVVHRFAQMLPGFVIALASICDNKSCPDL